MTFVQAYKTCSLVQKISSLNRWAYCTDPLDNMEAFWVIKEVTGRTLFHVSSFTSQIIIDNCYAEQIFLQNKTSVHCHTTFTHIMYAHTRRQ